MSSSKILLFVCALLLVNFVSAQQVLLDVHEGQAPGLDYYAGKPFYEDIRKFQAADQQAKPPAKAILLIGSSSFTNWKNVSDYFPGYKIINRGFGGSTLPDLIRYQDFIVYPYQPKQILVYCGENDFAASDTVEVATVVNRFKQLYWDIRLRLPKVDIAYVSMKPSPSRKALFPKFISANNQIRDFLSTQRNTSFIDVYPDMLDATGYPIGEIFTADSLHMNAKGYEIWQKKIKPVLKK